MPQPRSLHRRHFIVGAAGAAGVLAAGDEGPFGATAFAQQSARPDQPLPDYVKWKNEEAMIVHSKNTLETKRDFFGTSGIMPGDELFVRNNLPAPNEEIVADRDAWEVSVEGVQKPRNLTVGQLKNIGIETVAAVLQCSGNGRDFFAHKASGTQWRVGAAGNLFWSGVPIAAVVEHLGGLVQGRRYMTGTGGETLPKGIDPKTVIVERSVPIAAMEHALLAWEMNGKPVPLAHGGPLRLVIPGYYGVNNVKYVKRLAFTEQESDANIQRTGYRVRPVGVKGAPDQPSMWEMNVKSWVTHPLKQTEDGPVLIYGVAFGGINTVKSVDVSTDGGKTWKQARFLGADFGRFAWRSFVFAADLAPGSYTIASRANDTQGRTQPETFEPNERGYGHNGWRDHAVSVTVT
ncbi:sulfite oxidase [Xanthobacteraceae bacterium Astr-EGSB]|uniref:SorT family sulfite dehydrogenase catalytic subunit n=1 Tax=Astrobacterium formosum TaxID=3069710 RepID=UPI0027B56A42|nr:sulfite oxidase [Xanthobacteraceae bacterium Astr-EGSB]